jgi:Family of unknown function (DUF6370)
MRKALSLLALALVFALAANARAEEKTLKGSLTCGKCTLKLEGVTKCTNVLQVKEGDKTVNYILEDEGMKAPYHKDICPPGKKKDVSVTGTVREEGGKKYIKPSKVE